MTTTELQDLRNWDGQTVVGSDGGKIGKVADVYFDDATGQPAFLAVTTGLFGNRVSFVPVERAGAEGDQITVPYTKDTVKDAPNVDPDGHLSETEEDALYRHYGMNYSETGGPGHDTSGPNTDEAMTRSEEELVVGTRRREAGRARLRKRVETEHVSTTVPVAHEEVWIEREPITDGNIDKALDGPEISEEVHEVTLTAQEPVVAKEIVPKERVRLQTDTVVEEQEVGADIRKERIEAEVDQGTRR